MTLSAFDRSPAQVESASRTASASDFVERVTDMSKAIPKGLTKQHVLSALADLDSGVDAPFGPALGYELVHNGNRYAPKAVIGLAFKHLTGQILDLESFRGGEATGQANYVLRELGFKVFAKTDGAESSFITSRGFARTQTR
jgi:hypothetical protein